MVVGWAGLVQWHLLRLSLAIFVDDKAMIFLSREEEIDEGLADESRKNAVLLSAPTSYSDPDEPVSSRHRTSGAVSYMYA